MVDLPLVGSPPVSCSPQTIPRAGDDTARGYFRPPHERRPFAGRTHRLVSQDGWEEIADYALDWALEHATEPG